MSPINVETNAETTEVERLGAEYRRQERHARREPYYPPDIINHDELLALRAVAVAAEGAVERWQQEPTHDTSMSRLEKTLDVLAKVKRKYHP